MAQLGRPPIELGAVLDGRYRIDSVLGQGGMGIVFTAHHLELRQTVAIKMPYLDGVAQHEVVERLMREARAAVRLKSEHVCRVLDVGKTEQQVPYVVLEYLEGESLSQRLKRKQRLDVDEIFRILLEACEAVGEAHRLGIVHRDLKPHNIFLVNGVDGRRRVKVLDFGISKIDNLDISDHRLTQSTVLLGSPSYIAPEQMSDTRGVDARADIWGLGVCAYEMLTGVVPFKGQSLMDLAVRISRDAIVPPSVLRSDTPAALERIVMRCLEKDREQRFASTDALADALLEVAPASLATEFARTKPSPSSVMLAAASSPSAIADFATTQTSSTPMTESEALPALMATRKDPVVEAPASETLATVADVEPRRSARPYVYALVLFALFASLATAIGLFVLRREEGSTGSSVSSARVSQEAPPTPGDVASPSSVAPRPSAVAPPEVSSPKAKPRAAPAAPTPPRASHSSAPTPTPTVTAPPSDEMPRTR